MSTSTTLEIPQHIASEAERLAKRIQARPDAILKRCIADGMAEQSVNTLFDPAAFESSQMNLTMMQQAELTDLAGRREQGLSGVEHFRLDELLRLYRQNLVRKAQAITDWLADGGWGTTVVTITQLTRFESSMLYAAGYDPVTQTLELVFSSGGIYRYFDVPPAIYAGLLAAESKGRYTWMNVINAYPYERLRPDRE
ncbi:hypothetical protein BH10CHL1_BH10CHL1_29600 [soil metagenome]